MSPRRPANSLTWIIGGTIAAVSAYVAYRLLVNPNASARARWSGTIAAALMLLLFGYSLFDPDAWARLLGAKLPGQDRAAVVGQLLALILLVLIALTTVWFLRGWIWT